ncbi:MAG: M20 family metallopeptidase [Clostridiales bacterium]|jgi:succinyl-diaminopimelate desuccinylase|nr:M20 family metallopeptidase [Clostridiales bacterium]
MLFGDRILQYKEDILHDIKELVSIPSCAVPGSGTYPYGEEAARALQWILHRAEEMGLSTTNVDNAAGHAQYGEGEEIAAVLTHVDVVPAGEGWTSDPFQAEVRDGKLFGRGVADDKGCAVVALYCLKALKDAGVTGKRRLRAIFGSGEECGMDDMPRYFASQEMPRMAFTPDSDYGICNREKGILQIEVSAPTHDGTTLTAFQSGTVVNAVPDKATVLLDCTETDDHQLQRLADAKTGTFEFRYTLDGMMVQSMGVSSHAMEPQKGFNAATHLIRLLASNFGHSVLGSLCAFLDDAVNLETNGLSLGIRQRDAESGALTLNVGLVDIGPNHAKACIDIRYPVTADGEQILETIRRRAARDNLTVRILNHNKPLYVPQDHPLIALLQDSYQSVTAQPAALYSTGGGTYARQLQGRGVAFGPVFEGQDYRLHKADEFIDIEAFMLHAQICLEAMYRMMTQ